MCVVDLVLGITGDEQHSSCVYRMQDTVNGDGSAP